MAGVGSPKFTSANAPRQGGKAGRVHRKTLIRKNIELLASGKGIDAREFMLGVVGDETLPLEMRQVAARDVAPYTHAKKPTTLEGPNGTPLIPSSINIAFTKGLDFDPTKGGGR